MALLKKSELLRTVEGIPGTQASPSWAGSDAADVLDLGGFGQTRTLNQRQAARASLTKTVEAIGRGGVTLPFSVDLKGSGTATTLPDYDDFLVACLMHQTDIITLSLSVAATLLVGDLLTGASSGATAIVMQSKVTATSIPIFILQGTFTNGETINRTYPGGSLTAGTPATVSTPVGKTWHPWSQPALTFETTGAWSGSDPSVGETIVSNNATTLLKEGSGTVIAVNGTTTTVEWNWGTLTANAALVSTSGKTATVAATPAITQTEGKSLTMRPNRDGLARPVYGAKGTFAIQGEAGGQSKINFTFTGKPGTPTDIGLQTGTSFATTVPPRLIGGVVLIDGAPIPIKSYQLDLNNTVVMSADGNSSEGDKRADITDRDPTLTLELDQIGVGSFNWWSKWSAGTTVRVALQFGSTTGNIMSLICGKSQISELNDGDTDGIATHTVTLKLRGETDDGDNEFFIGHI